MEKAQLESFLSQSLSDERFDNQEKRELRGFVLDLGEADRNFVRNRAFDLARDAMADEGSEPTAILEWLRKVVKVCKQDSGFYKAEQAYFSPGTSCREAIVQQIRAARKQIEICVFTISDDVITKAILEAHQRNIDVRIISDNDKSHDLGSDIERMQEAGVQLRLDHSPYHMHHKFALFDRRLLINGSFNWTRSASTKNQENIVLSYERILLREFSVLFEQLWEAYE
ncbi:phospholipase D-like domain-containing protein [Pseudoteredinibacter isoporae]|uniref:phospholipase D n=1 Tax=Pseudoteredinibacter isoporae TaxID=570281 RepID=A0A7X0MX92_9GAMM|nr:phospholipase D-like domain-containing protein [Pseudoteredinibacter isoporae]MBB6520652.1 phosphatidylserine/phosphatidylglycerophosphate/cardiolipin synthase-like enzyme [Pseudoteredinibacter isoporae]NHO86219.1 nuclease [Pseudoteredinibacter isoporae]NIB25330.1 nuclease [Pseudoteredinibacter isoporae]